jgi:hypothetical protein
MGWMAEEQWFNSWQSQEIFFSSPQHPDQLWSLPRCDEYHGLFPGRRERA